MSCVRTQVESLGLSSSAVKVIMALWRKGTKVQYQTYLTKWIKWCTDKGCNPLTASISAAIDFLANLYDLGYSYSSINTARSALSSLLQSLPRYSDIWDINPVFNFIRKKPDLDNMTLK
jgi:site-specific recombinase XerD